MNKWEQGWLALATATVIGAAVISGASPVVLMTAIAGILFVVLVAFKNQYANLFGLILALLFGQLSFAQGYYMNAISNIFYIAPASAFGWWYWTRNKDKPVQTLKGEYIKITGLCIITVLGLTSMVYRAILFESAHPILDGISGFLPLVATYLLILRYKEQWIMWIPYNIIEVYLWFAAASVAPEVLAILVMRVVFMINSFIGAYNWYKVK